MRSVQERTWRHLASLAFLIAVALAAACDAQHYPVAPSKHPVTSKVASVEVVDPGDDYAGPSILFDISLMSGTAGITVDAQMLSWFVWGEFSGVATTLATTPGAAFATNFSGACSALRQRMCLASTLDVPTLCSPDEHGTVLGGSADGEATGHASGP